MEQPLVSIVVPIYNVEKYLDRCIESIVKQTYQNIEIILVDDGSPDHCPAMCDEWAGKDARIKVVHKQNAGLGMARNTGMDHAEGKYIFFFDSDDYVDCTIVEKCVASAEQNEADAVVFGRCDVYDDGRVSPKKITSSKLFFHEEEIKNELLPGMFTYKMGFGVSVWGKMYRFEAFKKLGIRFVSEREIISEDAYFALVFFSKIQIVSIVPEALYFYYKRGTSLSRMYKADRQQKNDIFLSVMIDYIQKNRLPKILEDHVAARYQMFSISAMKQIMLSDMGKKEKHTLVSEIFKNPNLRKSIKRRTLQFHGKTLRLFFRLMKLRCYFMCRILLSCKTQKGE